MLIDPTMEEHVREAYRGVVGKDGDRMVAAFQGLSDEDFLTAVGYGLFVCGTVVNAIFPNGSTEGEIRDLAGKIVTAESSWIDLGAPDTVARFLSAASKGDTTFGELDKEDVLGLTFVCGGHLLSRYRLKDQRWWEYLDEIWATAEASNPA